MNNEKEQKPIFIESLMDFPIGGCMNTDLGVITIFKGTKMKIVFPQNSNIIGYVEHGFIKVIDED
jgi:hypothetical protein